MQPVGNIFFFTRVRCWVVALLLVCTLKFILPKIKQSFSESPVKCTQPKDKKAAMVLLSLCLREMCPTGELKKLRWYHYKPLNVPGKYNTSLRLFLYSEQGFLYFVVLSSQRGYHTILWTNIIVLSQWNTKAEVPAGSVFLCTGKSYSSFLSTTKRDPLNVLSYVEQKVSEKAEKQCCKKDIT